MADRARILTDKELEKMERHLSAIYARAETEIGATWKKYLEEVDAELKPLQAAYDAAKKSGDANAAKKAGRKLAAKQREKTIMNGHYQRLTNQLAKEISCVNETAAAYVNGKLPSVYSLNYNSTGEAIKGAVSGYSFELVDASTVKNLATSDKTLLPYKYVDGKKDVRWNTTKINSEVLQGILQGESIPNIAKRLQNVTEMNRASAIRNARTTVTSAENKGRMDSLHAAAEKGVKTHKVWLATNDARVREAHALLDGQEQDIDDPFDSELGDIMYPGDPNADPANVYNCRCTLIYKVVGIEDGAVKEEASSEAESYAEELVEKKYSPNIAEFNDVHEYWDAKNAWQGEKTKYVDDMFEPGKFTSEAAWGRSRNEKISRIEGTIADLNDKYPALMSGDLEYGTRLEHLTVCDYNRAWEFLPNGELDRRLTDSASAQVFIVNEENKSSVVVAFNRPYLSETIEETIQNRQRAIDAGEVLSSIGYSPESTAIHEWGHVMSQHLDNAMIYEDETVVDYWNWYKGLTKEEIRQGLSDYATTNRGEFEAECFAEMHMPNPRPLALKFKEYLDEIIGKGY